MERQPGNPCAFWHWFKTARKCSRSGAASCGHPADKSSDSNSCCTAALWLGWSPCFLKLTACKPPAVLTPYEAKFPLSPAELQALHPMRQGDSCRSNQDPLEGSAGSRRKRSCHPGPSRSHFFLASWLIAPRPKQPLKQWAKIASKKTCGAWPEQPILSSTALQEVAGLEQKSRRENQIISSHAKIFWRCPNENWPMGSCYHRASNPLFY